MSTKSNNKGRAYEYAWIKTLHKSLECLRDTRIINNSSLQANEKAWLNIDDEEKRLFQVSAESAVDTILELEPLMYENDDNELLLEFQQDKAGIKGDVRDIVVKRDNINWEIGLSIKHNHEAVKHCRLSHMLDFGEEWFGIPCSKNYWDATMPIFNRLKDEKSKGSKWSDITDKEDSIYVPLLQAFITEIQRACSVDSATPKKMVEYLIGTNDYYKVISRDGNRLTVIHTFNIHGTLNKPSRVKVSAITVPTVKLPTELVALRYKTNSKNTIEMYLNEGWQLSFRIHNASTNVEPSLKFDIQFIGTPISILNIECRWKQNSI